MYDKNNVIFLNKENAPHCFDVFTNCDHLLLLETFERIKCKKNIFNNVDLIEKDKIKTVIIPALINDKLISETKDGLNANFDSIMFNAAENKPLFLEQHHKFVKNICSKAILNKKYNNVKVFEYVTKKVSKSDFDEITTQLNLLLEKIKNLKETVSDDTLDCEFSILTHSDKSN